MAYSFYDVDSTLYTDIVSQVIYTQDSTYVIPLEVIDSISFVQPETVYKADVTPITGTLLDCVIAVDSLTLTLSPQTPTSILPSVGDKIVSVDLKEPFPYGFLGRVISVNQTGVGYVVECEFIGLEEAVDQLYVTAIMATTDDGTLVKSLAPRHVSVNREHTFNIGEQKDSFDLSSVIQKDDVLSVAGKASITTTITPTIHVYETYVVNTKVGLYTKFRIESESSASLDLDVAGTAKSELWKKKFFSKDMPLAYGFTFYTELGAKVEASGELAVGVVFNARGRQTVDIVYCPLRPEQNTVIFNHKLLSSGANWHYVAARASMKACGYLELGIGYGDHGLAKVGGEFELGAKGEYESVLDFNLLQRADKETAFYEVMKEKDKIDVNAYFGAYFVIALFAGADDVSLQFSRGRDWNLTPEPLFQGRSLPLFDDVETMVTGSSSAVATTRVSGDLVIPQTIGMRVVRGDGHTVETFYRNEKYANRLVSDRVLEHELNNLQPGGQYKIYPIVKWFGYDIMASPSADLNMIFPVTLSDFEVTKSQYKKGEFKNGEDAYDYCFNVSVKAALDVDDLSQIVDWGYVYEDPNGQKKEISLKEFGTEYTDTRYAYYRNKPDFNCRLYGYVKYVGWDESIYGEPEDFVLEFMGITVTTGEATEVTDSSAVLYGQLTDFDLSSISEYGISYCTTPDDVQNIPASNIDEDGVFSVLIENLSEQTKYYYYAYGVEQGEKKDGEVLNFTTLEKVKRTVTTGEATEVTDCSVVLYGQLTDFDLSSVSEYGICYYTTPDDLHIILASNINEDGVFSVLIENLSEQTKYYYYAYGIEQGEKVDGEVLDFTTLGTTVMSTVTTGEATDITATSATLSGYISDYDSNTVSEYGICYYADNEEPTSVPATNLSDGLFSVQLTDLRPDETYSYYAYIIQQGEKVIGDAKIFITTSNMSVATGDAIEVTHNSVILYGRLDNFDLSKISEYGISYSTRPDDVQNVPANNIDADGVFSVSLSNLSAQTKYYYVAYAIKSGEELYGEARNFTTMEANIPLCPDDNHPHMIDLGLPSGTKWACCNVGANAPEEYGGYYAWGETQTKSEYNWDTYKYGSSSKNVMNIGSDIAGTSYDAATVNWGTPWCMPSLTQIMELLNNCTSKWTSVNGVNGRKFTGSNGSNIFLPAAGCLWNPTNAGTSGFYRSSTLYEDEPGRAYGLVVLTHIVSWFHGDFYRSDGLSVRPVR